MRTLRMTMPVLAAMVAVGGRVEAQSTADATVGAMDAFGQQVGLSQVGLYSATNIRGFDPTNSAAYRIDGLYFAQAGELINGVLAGTTVQVGANAARLTYPSPSGVVNFRLRGYTPGESEISVGVGTYAWWSPALQVDGSLSSPGGTLGLAGGAEVRPRVTYPNGLHRTEYTLGLVPEWRLAPGLRIRLLLSGELAIQERGIYQYIETGSRLPPPFARDNLLPSPSASAREYAANGGILVDWNPGGGWRVAAGAFQSGDGFRYDFTGFGFGDTQLVHVVYAQLPQRLMRSLSGEVRADRTFPGTEVSQQLTLAVRHRTAFIFSAHQTVADEGYIDPSNPVLPDVVEFADTGQRSRDRISQDITSIDYAVVIHRRYELRAGVDVSLRTEGYRSLSGASSEVRLSRGFPHVAAVVTLPAGLSLYGSHVRGLDDSGIAPPFAANANQVVPPAIARQSELGLKWSIRPKLTMILALFDTRKPSAGIERDGTYALVGEERHAGVELSLSGQATPRTRLVLGTVHMHQELSGPLVDAGVVGRHPVGTAPSLFTASIVHTLERWPSIALDGQFRWTSGRYVDPANLVRSPAWAQLDMGLRYSARIGRAQGEWRVSATNVLNHHAWDVNPSGSLRPIWPITAAVWATLSMHMTAR